MSGPRLRSDDGSDADITDFTHEESVCCIAGALMSRLREIAGI